MLYTLGMIFIIVGIIFKIFPPKKINYLYGHRTTLAMKNQDTWDEAQRYSANTMIILGILSLLLGLVFNFFIKNTSEGYQGRIFFIGIIIMILADEIHLRRIFNYDGSRK